MKCRQCGQEMAKKWGKIFVRIGETRLQISRTRIHWCSKCRKYDFRITKTIKPERG